MHASESTPGDETRAGGPAPTVVPGTRLQDFLLPVRSGVPTTFYERYCGRPLLLCFAADAADLAPFAAGVPDLTIVALVATARPPLPLAADDLIAEAGTLAAALGEPLPARANGVTAWLLDTTLRLRARLTAATVAQVRQLHTTAARSAAPNAVTATRCAPVRMSPAVLETALCTALIAAHDRDHAPSGMRRVVDGQTVVVPDRSVKSRSDHRLEQADLVADLGQRRAARVRPEIPRAVPSPGSRLDGWQVVCYDAADGGRFRPHRDNLAPDARHRRFALTVNLNDDYEGGALVFPEYGPTAYRPPPGGAIVFSGSLLHELTPVTAGRRYALLSFLWSEDALQMG